jgi:hypothetical protein
MKAEQAAFLLGRTPLSPALRNQNFSSWVRARANATTAKVSISSTRVIAEIPYLCSPKAESRSFSFRRMGMR